MYKRYHDLLVELIGKSVILRLNWGHQVGPEYKGLLASTINDMNVRLAGTEELIKGEFKGSLGECVIRCNLYIRGAAEEAAKA